MCPAEEPIVSPDAGRQLIVLVVEDEILIRMSVAAYLRSCGFSVAEAGSGVEARALIEAGINPDLIFSDITMPGGDGVAFATWLMGAGINVPVVLTSGVPDALDAAKAACANVRAIVVKPYVENLLADQFRGLIKAAAAG